MVMELAMRFVLETWRIVLEAAPYVLAGFLVAGILYIFLDAQWISKHLGKGRYKPVFLAALFGIPLPLCSCGVVPTAMGLRKQGANDGATVSFLISTPETGVDSMAVTWALMGPLMTVARPVAAFVTAVVAGISQNLLGHTKDRPLPLAQETAVCRVDGCCSGEGCSPAEHGAHHSVIEKFGAGVRYAFGPLLDDMAGWLGLGFILAGLIATIVPDEFITRYLGSGWLPMVVMLAAGVPMYICATASTPIAAALMLKGLSPGAALVFLLAGPATNIASLTVVAGTLGRRAVGIYLTSIVFCSLVFGFAVDALYGAVSLPGVSGPGSATELMPYWVEWFTGFLLVALILKGVVVTSKTWNRWRKKSPGPCDDAHCGCGQGMDNPIALNLSLSKAPSGKPKEEPQRPPVLKP